MILCDWRPTLRDVAIDVLTKECILQGFAQVATQVSGTIGLLHAYDLRNLSGKLLQITLSNTHYSWRTVWVGLSCV